MAVLALLALPFFAAFEALLRRGTPAWAALWGALGRILLFAVLIIGVGSKALPGVITLVLPLFVVQFLGLELFAAGAYGKARNAALVAVVDAVTVGWLIAMLSPIA